MKKAKRFSKSVNEAFSFIEVLVSLLIVSLVSLIMYFAFSSSVKTLVNAKKNIRNQYKIFVSEKIIRDTVASVDVPFWKTDFAFSINENSLSCNYLNGEVKTETVRLPYQIKILKSEIVYFEDTKPVGVKIEFEMENETRSIRQTFASRPLMLVNNE